MTSSSGWPTADLLVDHPKLRRAAEWGPAVRACSAHRYRDAHLWADQFDENRFDLLQMQDAIVARIAHAIGVKMTVERARWAQTRAVNPMRKTCLALPGCRRTDILDAGTRRRLPCEQALQIDPENIRALSHLSTSPPPPPASVQFRSAGRSMCELTHTLGRGCSIKIT
jgi:hypothetical protein